MHRLFVAIRPPADVRERLAELMLGVRNVRWQDDDQLHLTLRFIGEVERPLAEDIAAALQTVRQARFTLALSGTGSFEHRGKGALWAGVAPHDQITALHRKVDRVCVQLGLEPERRAYLPHITLARFTSAGALDAFVERSAALGGSPFEVDSFNLYESELTPQGPVYSVVARYLLDQSPIADSRRSTTGP